MTRNRRQIEEGFPFGSAQGRLSTSGRDVREANVRKNHRRVPYCAGHLGPDPALGMTEESDSAQGRLHDTRG